MEKAELLMAASEKLAEAILLLSTAGEERLASDAQDLAEWVIIRSTNSRTSSSTRTNSFPATR